MILGIDTSNYMTSVCLLDDLGAILFDGRRLLQVPAGKRGLQQSAALFDHLKNLPGLFQELGPIAQKIRVIGYSEKPRPIEGSYMPVFQAGKSFAISLAAALDAPAFATTHQEGHIAAGEASITRVGAGPVDLSAQAEFLAVHLSGGTTDLLHVRRRRFGYQIKMLGSGMDLHAGQFVDRVGVALGLRFPAGPALEQLARQAPAAGLSELILPSPVRGLDISFSGPLTGALRAIDQDVPPSTVARAVESCIAKGLEKVLLRAQADTGLHHVLIVGGVASNQFIRSRLSRRLEHPAVQLKLYFAEPRYSSDNAMGVATLASAWLNLAESCDYNG